MYRDKFTKTFLLRLINSLQQLLSRAYRMETTKFREKSIHRRNNSNRIPPISHFMYIQIPCRSGQMGIRNSLDLPRNKPHFAVQNSQISHRKYIKLITLHFLIILQDMKIHFLSNHFLLKITNILFLDTGSYFRYH